MHVPQLASRTQRHGDPAGQAVCSAPSPDHVGVLKCLQVPQNCHLSDGGQRHPLLAGLHPHPLQCHEATSVLQVPGFEHLPVGSFADLGHTLILLVSQVCAVLIHAAAAPLPPVPGVPRATLRPCWLSEG